MPAVLSRAVLVGLTAAVALSAGCAQWLPGNNEQRPRTVYTLQPRYESKHVIAERKPACGTLSVASPVSAPGYETSRMAYMEQPYRLDYFAFHRWADTPARMLEPLLVEAFERSGLFAQVAANPTAVFAADLRLETELVRLLQRFRDDHSVVHLDVRFRLIDLDSNRLLATQTMRIEHPTDRAAPYGGAVAANQATARLLEELTARVAESVVSSGVCSAEERNLRQ